MSKHRFFFYAILFEGGLAVLALVLGFLFRLPLIDELQVDARAWTWGLLGTLPLILAYFVLKYLPWESLREVDRLVRIFFRRYMAGSGIVRTALVAALAGLGEELLFRGLLQKGGQELISFFGLDGDALPWTAGVILAVSLLFGLAHAATKTYFILAFLVSIYFGILYSLSGNLFVPVLVHALYDFFVFLYLSLDCSDRPENDEPATEPFFPRDPSRNTME